MKGMTLTTDAAGRVMLPSDFASCTVVIERHGDELRIRKGCVRKRYTFKELMAGVTPENIHAEIKTGPPVGARSC